MNDIIKKIIMVDKKKEEIHFLIGDTTSFSYEDMKKVKFYFEETGTAMEKMFANMGKTSGFSSGSEPGMCCIKVVLKDGTIIIGKISDEVVNRNSLDYHKEKKIAEEIIMKLNRIIAKRDGIDLNFMYKVVKHETKDIE